MFDNAFSVIVSRGSADRHEFSLGHSSSSRSADVRCTSRNNNTLDLSGFSTHRRVDDRCRHLSGHLEIFRLFSICLAFLLLFGGKLALQEVTDLPTDRSFTGFGLTPPCNNTDTGVSVIMWVEIQDQTDEQYLSLNFE